MPAVFRRTVDERAHIADTLRTALMADPAVEFSFLLGSFLEDAPFHDIDIAVMLTPGAAHDATGASLAIGERLERLAGHPIDVRPLNQAPVPFQFKAVRGRLLTSRDDLRVADFIEYLLPRYFDLAPRLAQATKDAYAS